MNLALLVVGLALVALPGATAGLGRQLAPDEWARHSAVSLRAGLWAVWIGLLLTSAPAVAAAVSLPDVADACNHVLGLWLPGGRLVGWAAVVAVAVFQDRIIVARFRSREALAALRVEPWLGRHEARAGYTLVVVPTEVSLAYAVEGSPPQVVVSEGLAGAVPAAELDAIVRHELCHLDHGHRRHLELALAVDATLGRFGWARRSTAELRLAVERWADEAAADLTSRATVRHALETVALSMVAAATPPPASVAPAFTTAETVRARLAALATTPALLPLRSRLVATAPVTVLTATAVAILAGSPPVHHGVLTLLVACPL